MAGEGWEGGDWLILKKIATKPSLVLRPTFAYQKDFALGNQQLFFGKPNNMKNLLIFRISMGVQLPEYSFKY